MKNPTLERHESLLEENLVGLTYPRNILRKSTAEYGPHHRTETPHSVQDTIILPPLSQGHEISDNNVG